MDVPEDLLHSSFLQVHLEWIPSLINIEIKSGRFVRKDPSFCHFGQQPGLEGLEMDLEPGIDLVPTIQNATVPFFQNLKRLALMSYPKLLMHSLSTLGLWSISNQIYIGYQSNPSAIPILLSSTPPLAASLTAYASATSDSVSQA